MGYVRPERAKRPANRPKWPLQSLRRPVWAIRFFEIHDPGAFDEHFFNGLLELEFRRICDGNNPGNRVLPFEIVFADKKTNLTGLQLADLVARPVGLNYLRPTQANQAFELLKGKFFCDGGRDHVGQGFENVGLKVYPPQKAKSPDEPTEAVAPTGNPQST